MRRVFLDNGFAKVERDELGAQLGFVQALDDRVVPVDLLGETAHTVKGAALAFGLALVERLLLLVGRDFVSHAVSSIVGRVAAAIGIVGLSVSRVACRTGSLVLLTKQGVAGDDFGAERNVVGQLLCALQGLNLFGCVALGFEGGNPVLHQLVAALVKVRGNQGFAVRNQVLHAHAGHKGVAQGLRNSALQRDGIAKCGAHGQQRHHVTIAQGLGQALGIQGEVLHLARRGRLLRVDALNQGFLGAGQSGHTAPQRQHLLHSAAGLEFVNGALVGGTCQGNAWAGGRDHDDVAGLQGGIFGFVALGNKVVKVESGDGLAVALQADAAHAAVGARAAAGKNGVDQGRQAIQVVSAGLLGLAHHIHRDAAQFAQRCVDRDVVEHHAYLFAQSGFEVFDLHTIELECTDFGQVDLAIAVQRLVACVICAAPDLDAHFVARAKHVFGGCGCGGIGGISLRIVKQLRTKVGQHLPGTFLHKALKLAGRLGFGRTQGREGVALCIGGAQVRTLWHDRCLHHADWQRGRGCSRHLSRCVAANGGAARQGCLNLRWQLRLTVHAERRQTGQNQCAECVAGKGLEMWGHAHGNGGEVVARAGYRNVACW